MNTYYQPIVIRYPGGLYSVRLHRHFAHSTPNHTLDPNPYCPPHTYTRRICKADESGKSTPASSLSPTPASSLSPTRTSSLSPTPASSLSPTRTSSLSQTPASSSSPIPASSSSPTPASSMSPPTSSSPIPANTVSAPTPPNFPTNTNVSSTAHTFFSNSDVLSQIFPSVTRTIPYHRLLVSFANICTYPVLDNSNHMSLVYGLYIRFVYFRFPNDAFLPDINPNVEGIFRELNVQNFYSVFQCDTFPFCWESLPITLTGNIIVHPEHEFRGAKWRLYPGPDQINRIINRGTIFHIGSTNTDTRRYMATICRAVNQTVAIIQLNAYSQWQEQAHAFDPNWPTLTMVIPHCYNYVPMPRSQVKHFDLEQCGIGYLSILEENGFIL